MKIIVTGGAGFIGGNFVYYELKNHPEDEIICLDKLTYAGNLETLEEAMKNPKFKFVKGDIADRKFVYELFESEKPDIVINFAAESHVDRSIEDPEIFCRQTLWEPRFLWTLAENTELQGITRFLPMRFTVICLLTDPIYSLMKTHRFTPQVLTRLQRQAQICWCLHITERISCRLQLQDAAITTDRIISPRS